MLRLPRHRDLDPHLTRSVLPFYLRLRWLAAQAALAVAANFLWALVTVAQFADDYGDRLRHSIPWFVLASSLGYFFGRLGSRFIGARWLRILRGKEGAWDTSLGRATLCGGLALVAAPPVVNGLSAAEVFATVPFYSGAVVGTACAFLLWGTGLPR